MATTVEVLADAFKAAGTPFIVGHPGGESVELMEAGRQRQMRFLLMKQEVAGAMLASTWGDLTGSPGICLSTRGPGATNMVNGVAHALLDRAPLIAITDAYSRPTYETGLRQRINQLAIYEPIVKWSTTIDAKTARQQVRRAIRTLAGRPDLPVLPIVSRALLPVLRRTAGLDHTWLEIVAAVRPRLAPLEARQLDATLPDWPGAVAAPDASTDPWHSSGPVVVAYGPGVEDAGAVVAIAVLDGWTDSVPSPRHTTTAAFGFNAPKSRAPQAVLVTVPPDLSQRLDNAGLLDVVLETRELAHARTAPQIPGATLPYASSTALVGARPPFNFLDDWPA